MTHTEYVTIPDAIDADCLYGECEHIDENGEPEDLSACPKYEVRVCLDCMEAAGHGRDQDGWELGEVSLIEWPCADRAPLLVERGPEPEPPLFKPSPEPTEQEQDDA